ncbi:MAG TPA: hypothetical protein VM431_07275 [Phycisphaerae bacterium]|nr:hypothetical protein [Phycisphaerae bacterium]
MGSRCLMAFLLATLLVPVSARAQAVSVRLDPDAVRAVVAPAICVVTAENKWGFPLAVATGFLLGDGRFVVSDLGAVAQPGVEKVTLQFSDGATATAAQFGMADPALGLVALRVDGLSRRGLALAPRLPSLDGIGAVAAAGMRWGKKIEVVTGRVWPGPAIRDVAARTRVRTPAGVDCFLRMDGGRIGGASGSPVVDDRGTVLAVRLDVAARGVSVALAMPASSLRRSILESEPKLRVLSALPEPLWPVQILRLPGEPQSPVSFGRVRDHVRASVVCTECKGKGEVHPDARKGLPRRPGHDDVECPRCHGEGIALESGVYETLATWAEEGTRVVWAPGTVGRSQITARTAGQEMLAWLAVAGRHFREAYSRDTGRDVGRLGRPSPRGLVVYAEVRDTIPGPDGPYVILDPQHTTFMVAVRVTDLVRPDGRGPLGLGRRPPDKSWVILAGTVLGQFEETRYRGICMLPFEWTRAPAPGPVPGKN